MGKIDKDYKIVMVNLVVSADRTTQDIEEAVARALGIKIGAQPVAELEEFITVQGVSMVYDKEDILEHIRADYVSRETRREYELK